MLNHALIVKTAPQADEGNILFWQDYRVTVLGARLFRIEQSPTKKFRDQATQAVWFRNTAKQNFSVLTTEENAIIDTGECKLILHKDRGRVCVEWQGERKRLDNSGNLLGTYRTLDMCDGSTYFTSHAEKTGREIVLGSGVCSTSGVAVLDDSRSYTLGEDGEVKNEVAEGSDEYVFAFGDDYRAAVRALYGLTGFTPLVPRYALGNWWSRYHVYTDKEYLRVLAKFEEREIPLSVATVDMDWHYSIEVDRQMGVSAQGKRGEEYVGACFVNLGWTGYTWNEELFPDYRDFLKKVRSKGLKITLNVHPSDGVRFWETQYAEMAKAVGVDASTQKQIPFDFSYDGFIIPYFDVLHRPYEEEGVDFWWLDWQQPDIPWHDGGEGTYDPLWALNHYHYLYSAGGRKTPLVLSRYAGIGSHRYPLGFSGDTFITWKTLAYLPYFTATASNVGYTWWSHDIGGHHRGEKEDELYVRHVQYGVFSPVNRLHCTEKDTMTKEPWAYENGSGLIAEQFLRLRHQLVPYLYTASRATHAEGKALIEPLYYAYKEKNAYEYPNEYLFGTELLVAPVVTPREGDGYARIKAWLPEGKWTDIFTGDEYEVCKGGKELTLYRTLDSIPALAKEGAILPLCMDKGNGCPNPERLEVWSYLGRGEYTLYEDGKETGKEGEFFTYFSAEHNETEGVCTQRLRISSSGDRSVIPQNRILSVRFKNLAAASLRLFIDGVEATVEEWLTDCAAIRFPFQAGKTYQVEATYAKPTRLSLWKARAQEVLMKAEGTNRPKYLFFQALAKTNTEEEFLALLDEPSVSEIARLRLKEIL